MKQLFFLLVGSLLIQYSVKAMYPLHNAAKTGDIKFIQTLVSPGIGPNRTDGNGYWTWLYRVGRHICKVAQILYYKTDINQQDSYGSIPLHWAAGYGHEAIVQIFINAGAHIDQQDLFGKTPFYWACEFGQRQAVQILLNAGADINKQDKSGETPLRKALLRGHQGIVQLINDHLSREEMLPFLSAVHPIRGGNSRARSLTEHECRTIFEWLRKADRSACNSC